MYDNLVFAQDHTGILWAFEPKPGATPPETPGRPILAPGHEFHNLFAASCLLYRIVSETKDALELFVPLLEDRRQDDLVNAVQELASSLSTAKRIAENGLRELNNKNNG